MNVEIGTEAAQFPEKEYINGIVVAVCTVDNFRFAPLLGDYIQPLAKPGQRLSVLMF
jgi:hypothetical protein